VTDAPSQISVSSATIETDGVKLLDETTSWLLTADALLTQVSLDVISTVTTSPSFSALLLNDGLLVPTFDPFTFHWYKGLAPPFVGVAVKVTRVPSQIFRLSALIETAGVTISVMVTVVLHSVVNPQPLVTIQRIVETPGLKVPLASMPLPFRVVAPVISYEMVIPNPHVEDATAASITY
jgi:hypothetical protein